MSGSSRRTSWRRSCTASTASTRLAGSAPPATWPTPSPSCSPPPPAGSPAPSGTSTAASWPAATDHPARPRAGPTTRRPGRPFSQEQDIRSEEAMAEGRVRVRRVYEEPESDDGTRVLVDRIWPRGLTKAKAALDEWCKHVAPSDELRKWYGHDPGRFAEFSR